MQHFDYLRWFALRERLPGAERFDVPRVFLINDIQSNPYRFETAVREKLEAEAARLFELQIRYFAEELEVHQPASADLERICCRLKMLPKSDIWKLERRTIYAFFQPFRQWMLRTFGQYSNSYATFAQLVCQANLPLFGEIDAEADLAILFELEESVRIVNKARSKAHIEVAIYLIRHAAIRQLVEHSFAANKPALDVLRRILDDILHDWTVKRTAGERNDWALTGNLCTFMEKMQEWERLYSVLKVV